ncbi:MAG: L,D-transpeptidase family protein [Rhodobacteraceae bacterium]|nr:L,D-transpeptidase family protein [Paracoccaceae bacterium]
MNSIVRLRSLKLLTPAFFVLLWLAATPVGAQVTAFKQAVAEAASADDAVAAFYRANGYEPLWTDPGEAARARRAALLDALSGAGAHGLPLNRYDPGALMQQMRAVRTTRDLGLVEVALSRAFLGYARDVQSGILTPSRVDEGIVREVKYRDATAQLTELAAAAAPSAYMRGLAPRTAEYRALMKQKMRLEDLIASGGWGGTVPGGKYAPGESGAAVIALRDRLIRMGYLDRSAARDYNGALETAVQRFQLEHGLEPDGVAGPSTVEEINVAPQERLKSVIVAMERERWLGDDRGERHILVNLTDFTAKIVDHGQVTFRTRSVVGKNLSTHRSPEFSDVMEHMIVNPSWHVPRSIMTKEYLPQLQRNPNAAGHLIITDRRGRRVDRGAVDFTQFSTRNFPFDMRQPPGARNALGRVKFMFPNRHNIYLHDTPEKALFKRESRAFSHGCIRLADPFDFAYAILERQSDDPKAYFGRALNSGRETKVELVRKIPVHIIYRTAFTTPRGRTEYRRDVYGRDARIWDALQQAGVALPSVQG